MSEKTKIPLQNLQAWMQQVLIDPLGTSDKKPADFLPADATETHVEAFIKPSSRLTAMERLAIYQRGYLARLRSCMAAQFRTLEYALGGGLFQQFADLYIQKYPSTHYNLIDLGERFAQFLEETRPDKEQLTKETWIDFMIELIEFEYQINLIFDEKEPQKYDLAKEDTLEKDLKLAPIFYCFEHQFPVLWFYQSFNAGKNPELPFIQQTFSTVVRHNFKLSLHHLNKEQFDFFQYLKAENSVFQAKEKFISEKEISRNEFEEIWEIWKRNFIKAGFLVIDNQ